MCWRPCSSLGSLQQPRQGMDFLFLHQNFPAQFRNLIHVLGRDERHRVVFLTNRADYQAVPIQGVEVHRFVPHRELHPETHPYLQGVEQGVLAGQAVVRCLLELGEQGFKPHFIVSHAGTGVGLYLDHLFPEACHIGYFEWFFRPEDVRWTFPVDDLNARLRATSANLLILQELETCDIAVVPTAWQKSRFPGAYAGKINVIFDGIDGEFFVPGELPGRWEILDVDRDELVAIEANCQVLTYATRGMEPLRGFPEFMAMVPSLLRINQRLHVVVAGDDRCCYSYSAPSHGGSWKQHMLAQLGCFEGRDRLHFVGSLNYGDYRTMLRRSDLHCHFSRPYVPSWSLFEAAACGTPLLLNRGPQFAGIVDPQKVSWADLDRPDELVAIAMEQLDRDPCRAVGSRASALAADYSAASALAAWNDLMRQQVKVGVAPKPPRSPR